MSSIDEWTNQVHQGDAAETLREMPESSVHCFVTSPPYYLLRDYGEGAVRAWGADPDCEHEWVDRERYEDSPMREEGGAGTRGEDTTEPDERVIEDAICTECGAWRGQLGLEPTVDLYIDHLMTVFEEARRVLRPDGVLWINIDDKYATNDRGNPDDHSSSGLHGGDISEDYADTLSDSAGTARGGLGQSVRRKSMFGVPERLVLRMIEAGWVYRMRGVWRKLNPMPAPWEDRFTHHWEPIYLFTPEPDYWFDVHDVREPHQADSHRRAQDSYNGAKTWNPDPHPDRDSASQMHQFDKPLNPRGKNPGDVFEVSNPGYSEAHYAVFPDELVVKPIKAGCPPVVCESCGTPYDRESETVHEKPWQRETNGPKYLDRQHETAGFDRRLNSYHYPGEWEAQCDCDAGTEPGVALDPFAGRGTVGKVAAQHGRRFVLIDLDPESVGLATDYVPRERNGTLTEFKLGASDD